MIKKTKGEKMDILFGGMALGAFISWILQQLFQDKDTKEIRINVKCSHCQENGFVPIKHSLYIEKNKSRGVGIECRNCKKISIVKFSVSEGEIQN